MKHSPSASFRTRLIILVTGLLAGAVLFTTILLGWSTRQAVLEEAEANGELLARLLARSASLAREIPRDMENVISDQMVAQAVILAHFIDAAEQAGLNPEDINRRLRAIVDETMRRNRHIYGCCHVVYTSSPAIRRLLGLMEALISSGPRSGVAQLAAAPDC